MSLSIIYVRNNVTWSLILIPWYFNFSLQDETSNEGLVVDVDGPVSGNDPHGQPRGSLHQFGESPPKIARLGHNFAFGVSANARMRQSVRGASKRGRPRGSRRGGPIGGKGRGLLLMHPSSKVSNVVNESPSTAMPPIEGSGCSNEVLRHCKYLFFQWLHYPFIIFINRHLQQVSIDTA